MQQRPRGNLLMMTLALTFIMVTLVAALHHYEAISRRAIFAGEAELQLRQVRRWELAAQLNKLPTGARPPAFLTVLGNTVAITTNTTQISAGCAGNLFNMASDTTWNGLPDLSIVRIDAISNATRPLPPAFKEYEVKPTSSNQALNVFSRRVYREVITSLPPYAAYAPKGSINLESCVGWSNPAFDTGGSPLGLYSGLPTVVAAGNNVTVANMPYGVTYAGCTTVQQGMNLPLPNKFPVRPFEDDLCTNISTQMGVLTSTAQTRDSSKTTFINGAPPSAGDLLGMITGDVPNFEGYLSLNASLKFPFPVIPGFTTITYPMCYFAFQFWFHAAYPPDGKDGGTDPMDAVEALGESLKSLQIEQAKLQHALDGFKGTGQVAGSNTTTPEHSGPGSGTITVGVPTQPPIVGVVPRSEQLLKDLKDDLVTIEASNTTAAVTTGLKTDQSLLSWMADYGPSGYGQTPPSPIDPKVPAPRRNFFGTPPTTDVEKAYLNHNIGLLDSSKDVWPSPAPTDTTLGTPKQFYNGVEIDPEAAITTAQWNRILDPNRDADWGHRTNPGLTTATRADQIALLKLLTDTTDPKNPFVKAEKIRDQLQPKLDDVTQQIAAKKQEITDTFDRIQSSSNRTVPDRRLNDIVGRRGQTGFCYSRFGYSYDLFFNLIKNLVTGDFSNWEPDWPLVFYGKKDNARMPVTLNGAFIVTGTFTVPQNRTFYYSNPMSVRGDLWLQRGSTMVVGGALNVDAPSAEAGNPSGLDRLNFFRPCGRILLEEGASLIVQGDLTCQGTLERGSIIVTGPVGAIHPITSGVHATGRVTAPYGIYNGLGVSDMLPALGLTGLNRVLYPAMAYVAPNLAKAWGPFHRRNPFFANKCTAYQLVVIIGPFGIPIPILTPWPVPPRTNAWVGLYRGLSLFYTAVDNLNLGENLYPQADWWPGSAGTDLCGIVPIAPKLDPNSVIHSLANMSVNAPSLDDMKNFATSWVSDSFKSLLTYVTTDLFTTLVSKLLVGMLPAGSDAILNPILDQLDLKDTLFDSGDSNSTLLSGLMSALSAPLDDLQQKVQTWLQSETQDALVDSLAHEVAGVLVSGRSISIGMNAATGAPMDPPPYMASGMFVATGEIQINTLYTIGTIVSRDGSINSGGAKTRLLYYPYHGQGSLFKPINKPTIETQSPLKDLAWPFLQHAANYQYGTLGDPGTGLDFGAPGVPHVTAEGWEQ